MVVNSEPKNKKMIKSETQIKNEILEKMFSESVTVISLAYFYAKNFEEMGEDLSKRWKTLEEQNAILQKAYNKGYEDCLEKMKQEEKKEYPLGRNDWQE